MREERTALLFTGTSLQKLGRAVMQELLRVRKKSHRVNVADKGAKKEVGRGVWPRKARNQQFHLDQNMADLTRPPWTKK